MSSRSCNSPITTGEEAARTNAISKSGNGVREIRPDAHAAAGLGDVLQSIVSTTDCGQLGLNITM